MENYSYPDNSAERNESVAGYRILALLVCALTVGGLFLGLLGKLTPALAHTYYAGGSPLAGSLFGYLLAEFKAAFTGFTSLFQGAMETKLLNIGNLLLTLLLAVAAVGSVVFFVLTLVMPARARKLAMASGKLSLAAYGLLFLWAYCLSGIAFGAFTKALFDVPTAIIAGVLLVCLLVPSVARNKAMGFLNFLLLVFALAMVFALTYPTSYTGTTLLAPFGLFSTAKFYCFSLIAVAAVLLFNVIVSDIRLTAEKCFAFDAIRYALQFVLILMLAVAACLAGGGWSWAFFGDGTLLPSLILIIASLGAILLSLILVLLARSKAQSVPAAVPEETPAPLTEEPVYTEPAPLYEEPVYAEEPVNEPEPELVEEVPAEPSEPETIEEEPEEEPVLIAEPDESQPEPELSDFEREMLGYAAEPAPATIMDEPYRQPSFVPYAARPVYQQPVPVINNYDANSYTYDPFLTTLTVEEKNEFGDLFIACKRGKYGDLPVYRIGGDNAEFFKKVWIRYAMYEISPNLKDKLFTYIRSLKR